MSVPIYIDTNVYLDHFESRSDRLRPLGDFATQLLKRVLDCEFDIIVSSLVIDELVCHVSVERVNALLFEFKARGKLIRAQTLGQERQAAREISRTRGTPVSDTLHAIIAQRMNASYLVTRNLKDFGDLRDLVPIRLPELL